VHGEWAPIYSEPLRAFVLDPRLPPAGDWIIETCRRLVSDYGYDGLKIDFLDQAMLYSGTARSAGGDFVDVAQAMCALPDRLRTELDVVGPGGALIEFRQPYFDPAVTRFANLLRASDCPAAQVLLDITESVGPVEIAMSDAGGRPAGRESREFDLALQDLSVPPTAWPA
jgi:hypothetical protein